MQRRDALRAGAVALGLGGVARSVRAVAVRSAPAPFEPLSHLTVPGTREAVVGEDGRFVYLAASSGFAVVDVTDPAAPELVAERRGLLADREDGPMRRVHDVAVDGDRLALAGPSSGTGLSGALVYDVSDPTDPRRLAVHETPWPVHNCDLAGDALYLTALDRVDNPLVRVDLTADDPDLVEWFSPVDRDETWREVPGVLRLLHDVTVADGIAYCCFWDAGTWLVDVTGEHDRRAVGRCGGPDPEALADLPTEELLASIYEPPGNAHSADPGRGGDLLAVGAESWDDHRTDDRGGPSGITLYDAADPADPVEVATVAPVVPRDATRRGTWTTAHNFELRGDRLYSSWYRDGVKVHDVSDPANPEELAHWRRPDDHEFWTAQVGRPGEFFVASDTGTRVIDDEDAGLFCFPDRAGTQPDQPPIEAPTPTPTGTSSTTTPTATRSSTSTPTGTHSLPPTPASPTPGRPPAGGTTSRTPTATTPGFGVLGTLGGLALAAWRRVR